MPSLVGSEMCIRDRDGREPRIVRCHHDSGNNKAAFLLRLLRAKVSNHHGNRQTCKGILCVSALSPYNIASLGLWTLPFCSLACFSSDVLVALHRFPSSHAPVFLGWHINGVGPLPPPAATTITARRQGPPVDRRARGTWTATLDYVCLLYTSPSPRD